MKRLLSVIGALFLVSVHLYAQQSTGTGPSFGILYMAGGRYDDVRMCVATDAGVKGGPMGDVQLVTRWHLSSDMNIAFNLPVFRPILFISAFKMVQFEPMVDFEMISSIGGDSRIITGPGMGISIHHGPGYESDLKDPDPAFNAIGPTISWKMGFILNSDGGKLSTIGGRIFYTPLFAEDHSNGKVIGLAFEYQREF